MASKEYVGTVGFNLAGDQEGKTNYMVNTVLSAVLGGYPAIGKTIVDSYIKGPGRNLLSYYKWATKPNSLTTHLGMTTGVLSFGSSTDTWSIKSHIASIEGVEPYLVEIYSYQVGPADLVQFITKHVLDNYPNAFTNGSWDITKVEATVPPTVHITVSIANPLLPGGGGTQQVTFTLPDYDVKGEYLYVEYTVVTRTYSHQPPDAPSLSDSRWVTGTKSTNGYQNRGSVNLSDSPQNVVLNNRTTIEVWYSDGRPGSNTTDYHTVNIPFIPRIERFIKPNTKGEIVAGKYGRYEKLLFLATVPKVVEEITTQPINTQTFTEGNPPVQVTRYEKRTDYRYQFQEELGKYIEDRRFLEEAEWDPTKMLILKQGTSGNEQIERLFGPRSDLGTFFPALPVRINNKWVQDAVPEELFKLVKKGFKKATSGGKLLKLQKKMTEDTENQNAINDMDYIYVMPGASVRSKERDALRCIFELFRISHRTEQERGKPSFSDYLNRFNAAKQSEADYLEWVENGTGDFSTKPPRVPYPPDPMTSLAVKDATGFNILIQWAGLEYSSGSGKKKPGAKRKDCWFESTGEKHTLVGMATQAFSHMYTPEELEEMGVFGQVSLARRQRVTTIEALDLFYQKSEDQWECFRVWGFTKHTRIHHLIATITAADAFENRMDNLAEANSFIVPLHRQIYKELKLLSYTQATLGILHLHINWYVKVKKKWYQTGLFAVLLIIVVIVVAVFTGYVDANTLGMLGANGAVGAAITGAAVITTTTVIVGAIANAVAAVVVGALITKAATAVAGEKIGAIIGAVLSFVVLNWNTIQNMSQSFTTGDLLNQLTSPQMLVRLSLAASGPVSSMFQANAQSIMAEEKEMMAEYQQQIDAVRDLSEQVFSRQHDTIEVIANALRNPLLTAPPDFFQRTLITGTEFADLTMDVVSRFCDVSLANKLPGI